MEENIIQKAYRLAQTAGLCRTYAEFAELIGVNPTTISRAKDGDPRYMTNSLVFKAEKILQEHGVFINGESVTTRDNTNNETPQENNIAPLVAEMAAQREMYDKHLSEALRIISKLTEKNG